MSLLLDAIQGEHRRAGRVVDGGHAVFPGFGLRGLACDDTLIMSERGRPSPLPFAEARGGP
jgi:hypothetical protein